MSNFTLGMKLIPWQVEVDRCPARFKMVKAGRKAGKTDLAKWLLAKNCSGQARLDDETVSFMAPSKLQAKKIFWRRIKKFIPRAALKAKPNETELFLDFANDIRLQLDGADSIDASRGITIRAGVIEEADFIPDNFYEDVYKPNLSVLRAPVMFISSPMGRWFTRMWNLAKRGALGPEYAAFYATIYDNPHISRDEIEMIKRTTPDDIFQREYMAKEDAMTGLQYAEFLDHHIVPHREPQTTFRGPKDGKGTEKRGVLFFGRGLDWGFDHPSHCLWGEITQVHGERAKLYIFGEFSIRGASAGSVATPILLKYPNLPYLFNVIDSSARRTEMGTGINIIQSFANEGFLAKVPRGTDFYRINCAKMMLKNEDVTVSDRCPTLIRQLRNVEWGQTEKDDAADCFKYFCSMVYGIDFFNYEQDSALDPNNPMNGPIDPRGILAVHEPQDTMVWDKSGYLG